MQSLELSGTGVQGNTLQVFNCELGQVRVIVENGVPYFLAMDIAKALGYTDAESLTRRLDSDEVQNRQIIGFGNRGVNIINESGLYSAILGSKKDNSKEFKKWITRDVLPSIRKNGGYIAGQESMSELEILANALVVANNVIQQKSKELEAIKALRAKEKPLVDFANQVASASNSISVGEFAKLLNDEQIKIGQNNLFKWLRDNKYLMSDNMPYQKYIDRGYFEVVEQTYKTTRGSKVSLKTLVTGKGQIYFTEKLRKETK